MSSECEGPNDTTQSLTVKRKKNVKSIQRTGNKAVAVKFKEVSGYLLDRLRNNRRWIFTGLDGAAAEIKTATFW
jgi:hypothetical protein